MGENHSLILEKQPKKLNYLNQLIKYDQPDNWLEKAKTYIKKEKTRAHSISEWAKILGSSKTNPDTRSFLQKLVDQQVLVEEEKDGNGTVYYSLDKDQLIHAFYESNYYAWNRELFLKAINKAEPNRKIVTDF